MSLHKELEKVIPEEGRLGREGRKVKSQATLSSPQCICLNLEGEISQGKLCRSL